MNKILRACFAAAAASIMLAGCATYNLIKAAPAEMQPIQVAYSGEGASGWTDLPLGVYRVPNSQVIISGYQGDIPGVLFGLAGIAIQDAVQTGQNKDAVKNVGDALTFTVTDQSKAITDSLISSGQYGMTFAMAPAGGAPAPAGGTPVLNVVPYVVLTYIHNNDVRPFTFLRATLQGPTKNTIWSSRYIVSSGKALPLEGDNSFTANGGALLKAAVAKDLATGIKAMLADVAAPAARDEKNLLYVESNYPFMKQRMGLIGYKLVEDDQTVVFAPKVGDVLVFAGVEVLDKSVVTYRPATAADKSMLLDDPKPEDSKKDPGAPARVSDDSMGASTAMAAITKQ